MKHFFGHKLVRPLRGAFELRQYRHYRLDGAGSISSADWIEASDDADAVRQARDRKLSVASEVWSGNRLVARIEASPKPRR